MLCDGGGDSTGLCVGGGGSAGLKIGGGDSAVLNDGGNSAGLWVGGGNSASLCWRRTLSWPVLVEAARLASELVEAAHLVSIS